jgi:hypothetical protein
LAHDDLELRDELLAHSSGFPCFLLFILLAGPNPAAQPGAVEARDCTPAVLWTFPLPGQAAAPDAIQAHCFRYAVWCSEVYADWPWWKGVLLGHQAAVSYKISDWVAFTESNACSQFNTVQKLELFGDVYFEGPGDDLLELGLGRYTGFKIL